MAASESSPEAIRKQKKVEAERKRRARRIAEDPAAFREKRKASDKRWREANPEKARETDRRKDQKWKQANPEKIRAQYERRDPQKQREHSAAYYAAHAEQQRAASAAYRKANPERVRETNKKWHEANREAMAERQREYRAKNAEKLKKYYQGRKPQMAENTRQYEANPANRMTILIRGARVRAKRLGLECDGLHAIRKAFPAECACCNKTLDYVRRNLKRPSPLSPSLDRRDNTKGYTDGNVRVICYRCNVLKRDATPEEIEAILAYMRQ
jgi:hypothetical protein